MNWVLIEKIVFLDRDGVINKLVERNGQMVSPRTFMDFEILPGVNEAIARLKKHGFQIVIVTNQPDISRGHLDISQIELMNQLIYSVGVDYIKICPHSSEEDCSCRKPRIGLPKSHLDEIQATSTELWMIGDNESDVICGDRIGARTIRISINSEENTLAESVNADLIQAVDYIISCTVFG